MALSHIIGFDDFPFSRESRGDITIVGTVFCGTRLEGVLRGKIRRDGANSAKEIARLVSSSKFAPQVQLVMLQGIAMAGFNVVDAHWLHQALSIPVLIVARLSGHGRHPRRAVDQSSWWKTQMEIDRKPRRDVSLRKSFCSTRRFKF